MTQHRQPRSPPAKTSHRKSGIPAGLDADVRVGPLAAIPELLQEAGLNPAPIFKRARVDLVKFADPDHRIPFGVAGKLLAECASATSNPNFGLATGARFEFAKLGVLAHLMLDAPTVSEALLNLVRHLHLQDRGAVPFLLDLGRDQVALGYVVYRHDTPGIDLAYDVAIAVGCSMLRGLCGPKWKPLRVTFSHGARRDTTEFRRYFRARVHFNAAHSEIVFAKHWMDRPIAGADLKRHLEAERIALRRERENDRVTERARRAVQGLVMTGEAKAERVAAMLGMSARVLRRRLLAEGASLNNLINSARFEVARQLLRGTQLPLSEIAVALHHSDATAFSRAFRGWAAMSPSQFRNAS
ncbi:MAG: AraC family transcriptional regulator [Betaproteobacteria bacterium]